MPDLLTHLAAAHLARRAYEITQQAICPPQTATMFYVGSILPDLLIKPLAIIASSQNVIWFLTPTHVPVGVALISYAVVMLLPEAARPRFFRLLLLGSVLHFGLDLLQKHLTAGAYYWFFPFSWWTFHLPLFWPSDSILGLPALGGLIIMAEWAYARRCPRTRGRVE